MSRLTKTDINKMTKDELCKALAVLLPVPETLTKIMDELRKVREGRDALQAEVLQLKESYETLQNEHVAMKQELLNDLQIVKVKLETIEEQLSKNTPACPIGNSASNATAAAPGPVLSEVVSKSVKSAIQDERAKNTVVVGRMKECVDENKAIEEVCEKIGFQSKPTDVLRLGKKRENHNRPLKVTFACPFDARTFCSRLTGAKSDHEDIADLRVHVWRTKEEHAVHKKSSDLAYKLNQQAR